LLVGVAALALSLLALVAPSPAGALTVTVTTTTDGVAGSLRDAVDEINAGGPGPHTINLAADQTYQLTDCGKGYLEVSEGPLTINGNGSVIEQTCPGERILRSDSTEMLTLNQVGITGGDRDGNAGGVKSFGPVTVNESTFFDNRADDSGGGLWTDNQDVTVTRSTFAGNRADDDEDGAGSGGGVWVNGAVVTVSNSTFTDNFAADGGAVGGEFQEFEFATLVGNAASTVYAAEITMFGTVIADGEGSIDNCDIDGSTSGGYNWSDDDTCGLVDSTDTEDPGGDPMVGALADNGGPTDTMLPETGSPLLDAIPDTVSECGSTDQRGVSRPQVGGCDIGAVEVGADPPATTTTTVPISPLAPTAARAAEAVAVQPTFTG
jgi:hypothetical protein